MGFAPLVAIIGLVFGIISIRLMSIIENAQVVANQVRKGRTRSRLHNASLKAIKSKKFVIIAISRPRLIILRIGVVFFGRISSIIFIAEAMYPEKIVEGAAFTMMKTVLLSDHIRTVTRKSKHAIKKMKLKTRPNKLST